MQDQVSLSYMVFLRALCSHGLLCLWTPLSACVGSVHIDLDGGKLNLFIIFYGSPFTKAFVDFVKTHNKTEIDRYFINMIKKKLCQSKQWLRVTSPKIDPSTRGNLVS